VLKVGNQDRVLVAGRALAGFAVGLDEAEQALTVVVLSDHHLPNLSRWGATLARRPGLVMAMQACA